MIQRRRILHILDRRCPYARRERYDGPNDTRAINTWVRRRAIRPSGARKLVRIGYVELANRTLYLQEPLVFNGIRFDLHDLDVMTFGTSAVLAPHAYRSRIQDCSFVCAYGPPAPHGVS